MQLGGKESKLPLQWQRKGQLHRVSNLLFISFFVFSLSNGGFYPEKLTAEFSRHFVGSLRAYSKPATPAEIVRPKTTKGARALSKSASVSIKQA